MLWNCDFNKYVIRKNNKGRDKNWNEVFFGFIKYENNVSCYGSFVLLVIFFFFLSIFIGKICGIILFLL